MTDFAMQLICTANGTLEGRHKLILQVPHCPMQTVLGAKSLLLALLDLRSQLVPNLNSASQSA